MISDVHHRRRVNLHVVTKHEVLMEETWKSPRSGWNNRGENTTGLMSSTEARRTLEFSREF